jgi:hypothetical protein
LAFAETEKPPLERSDVTSLFGDEQRSSGAALAAFPGRERLLRHLEAQLSTF